MSAPVAHKPPDTKPSDIKDALPDAIDHLERLVAVWHGNNERKFAEELATIIAAAQMWAGSSQ